MVLRDVAQLTHGACHHPVRLHADLMLEDALQAALLVWHLGGLAVAGPVVVGNQLPRLLGCRHLGAHQRPRTG